MIREAVQSDLDAILELYLFLHEDSIPEKDGHLIDTWTQIIQDPNHHLIVNEVDGKIISSCVCVIIPNLTEKDCYFYKGSNPFSISSTTAINIIPD